MKGRGVTRWKLCLFLDTAVFFYQGSMFQSIYEVDSKLAFQNDFEKVRQFFLEFSTGRRVRDEMDKCLFS